MKRILKLENEKNSIEFLKKKTKQKKNQDNLLLSKCKQINFSKIYFVLIFLQLIQVGFNLQFTKKESFYSHANEITIKISGTGNQYIVYQSFSRCPSNIYLNSRSVSSVSGNCRMINIPSGQTNIVKLSWTSKLTTL